MKNLKETLRERVVPVDIALSLKKIGYDEKIIENYMYCFPWTAVGGVKRGGKYGDEHYYSTFAYSNTEWAENMGGFAEALRFDCKHPPISAPSYSMVLGWFLATINVFVVVDFHEDGFKSIIKSRKKIVEPYVKKVFATRYEAMDAAFRYIINHIETYKNEQR